MFSQPVEDIFDSFKKEVLEKNPDDDNRNVIIVCKNQETVETKKKLLLLYSRLFRSILCDVQNDDVVFVPDYTKNAIEKTIEILQFQWNEEVDSWNLEVVQLISDFQIELGSFQKKVKKKDIVPAPPRDIPIENRSEIIERPVEVNKIPLRKVQEANCPICPSRTFTGVKFKDTLKCHIGSIHFNKEILAEIDVYFTSSNCRDCGKVYTNNSQKKKHLIFNHTKYVDEVMKLVNQAVSEAEQNNEQHSSKEAKIVNNVDEQDTKTEAIISTNLENINTEEAKLFCSFKCGKFWDVKDNKLYIKLHLLSHFSKEFSRYHSEYIENKRCKKCPNNNANLTNSQFQNKHLYMTHQLLAQELEEKFNAIVIGEKKVIDSPRKITDNFKNFVNFQESFKSPISVVKSQNNGNTGGMPSCNQEVVDKEKEMSQHSEKKSNTEEITTTSAMEAGVISLQEESVQSSLIHEDEATTEGKEDAENESDKDDLDSLLGSDDEEDEPEKDGEDIQKLLLADNSDSDSDDDESSIGRRVSEDFENEEFVDFGESETDLGSKSEVFEAEEENVIDSMVEENVEDESPSEEVGEAEDIQNQLLMDQDMSDEEDDEEDEQGDFDNEDDTMNPTDTTPDNEDDLLQQNLLCDQDISDDEDMSDDDD